MMEDSHGDPEIREGMRDEYDFSSGIRGKYAERIGEGARVVVLDPDVAEAFPDSEAVNRALRQLVEIARRHGGGGGES